MPAQFFLDPCPRAVDMAREGAWCDTGRADGPAYQTPHSATHTHTHRSRPDVAQHHGGRGGKEIFERCKRTMTQVTSNWLARRLQLWRCQPTKHRMAAKPSHQPLSDTGAGVSSQMQPQSKNGPSFTSTDHQQDCRRCRLGQPPTVTAGLPGLPFACASQPPPRDC